MCNTRRKTRPYETGPEQAERATNPNKTARQATRRYQPVRPPCYTDFTRPKLARNRPVQHVFQMSTRAPEAKPLKAFTVPARPATSPSPDTQKIVARNLNFYYGAKRALEDITISISANLVTAFIGPSGCGKSTFLRTLNRMNDIIAGRARRRATS